jgi:predicted neutral ceramidase superfamily lipid hydrolase
LNPLPSTTVNICASEQIALILQPFLSQLVLFVVYFSITLELNRVGNRQGVDSSGVEVNNNVDELEQDRAGEIDCELSEIFNKSCPPLKAVSPLS